MADQRGMRRAGLAFIQQGFQPSHRSIEKEGFDAGSHSTLVTDRWPKKQNPTTEARRHGEKQESEDFVYRFQLGIIRSV